MTTVVLVALYEMNYLTYALPFPAVHRPQMICFHLTLSCAAASIFLQLYLKPNDHISFSRRSLVKLFFCCPAVSTVVLVWQ